MTSATLLFLYGTLRHRPLLRAVLGRDVELRPATLSGHAVVRVSGESYPSIRQAPGGAAEGVLLAATAEDLARLDFYEGAYHYALRPVTVETPDGPAEGRAYFPTDAQPPAAGAWSLDEWAAIHARATVLAARETMALMGRFTAEEARARYGQILVRAHSAVRAADHPAPARLRRATAAGEIREIAARRPYVAYFAVAEHDLAFPLFEGGESAPVTRAAFMMGDAVTVLPYDPARDRVALVEQFRFGPYMRGDPLPWSLEPVAGRIDPGETPEEAARRETREETGLAIGALHHAGAYYPSPAAVTEFILSYVGIADLPDDALGIGGEDGEAEDILGHTVSFEALMGLVDSGEAANGPLILTARWLAMNRERLRRPAS